jgi:4-amino-4-deoxy-L-arabinose transferase-like glycosyltransferase
MMSSRKTLACVSLGALVLLVTSLRLAVRGTVQGLLSGVMISVSFFAFAAALLVLWDAMTTARRLSLFTPQVALVFAATVIHLPTLGLFGLTDPWETHYAEVAREMLARGDAISTYWANEGWFTSKPILIFWLEAASMALCGVSPEPGAMLEPHGLGHPEWAIRMPHFVLSVIGVLMLYAGAARHLGKSRALMGSLVLLVMPHWILLTRQAITDMAVCAALCTCFGFILLALRAPEDEPVALRASDLLAFALFVMVAPQALYLVSRNIDLVHGFHADRILEGSLGTCGALPSHPPCALLAPRVPWLSPALQGGLWLLLLAGVVAALREVKTQRSVYFIAACMAAGVGIMAKGPLALAVPVFATLVTIAATRNVRFLFQKDAVLGAACIALLVLPWYVATFARHGRLFYDELVLRHMLGRTLSHLHDTTVGDDTSVHYYISQIGFAILPVLALLPGALAHALRAKRPAEIVWLAWALSAFVLVSAMGTKFHHYIFPAIPPLAMLVGNYLGALSDRTKKRELRDILFGGFGLVLAARAYHDVIGAKNEDGLVGASRLFSLVCYQYDRAWPASLQFAAWFKLLFAASLAAALLALLLRRRRAHAPLWLTLSMFALFVSHIYLPRVSKHRGQRDLVAMLKKEAPDAIPVAYQLNWKGENFYTGNRVAIFISSGAPFQSWLKEHHGTQYFLLEPSRIGSLRAELPSAATLTQLSSSEDNLAFTLVRATML